ncbi:MAG: hypothetical protein D6714_00470 [Bacteroidetes bacterium]|nr:MAG: hypothetical protein D6714_00470 [Bacteroidota bacterium]
MNYQELSDTSRVWIYQSSRPFKDEELPRLRAELRDFVQNWASHNMDLKAFGDIFHNRFIVLMVDESQAGASGCSIDASVRFIKYLEQTFDTNLFDRMTFAWRDGNTIKTAPKEQFARLYAEGKINDHTLVFDNLVKTKAEFDGEWIKPLALSWHKRMV